MSVDELAHAWRTAFRDGGFAELCTADVSYEDPVASEPLRGPDAIENLAGTARKAFPDLLVEAVGEPLERREFACIPWRAKGTHTGEVGSLPATNRFVVLHGLHYVELEEGAIRRARGFYDLHDVATQLGLLPRRGSLGEAALLLIRGFGLRVSR